MKSKALFLLVIFLLNTIVGLCCTLHVFHENHEETTEHHHLSSLGINHQGQSVLISSASISKDDPCCQGAVNNFASLAKLVPQTSKVAIQLPVVLAAFYHPYTLTALPDFQLTLQHFVVKRQRPPTSDTRIVIQSFQI
ncbi:MAG: hypothetical protein JWR54_3043 [Mucilaginibacter sp.]|nr:hypothetical protein [Mucilaginibacter sp.]